MRVADGLMQPDMPLYIAGHRGMVGQALMRKAHALGFRDIITATRGELDLTDAAAVRQFISRHRPGMIMLAAAKVGGIAANRDHMAEFLRQNLAIAMNVISAADECGVPRLLFLGSSCIYPRLAPQPMPESCLLEGALEPTNEGYALAKISGLKFCQYLRRQKGRLYHSVMPTNLYGPGDNYHPEHSHVAAAMIRRFHEARESGAVSVTIWGTGTPRREFMHADDLAAACFHLAGMENPPDIVNAGTGSDIPILEMARLVADVTGYRGEILTDPSRPDGAPRKLLDVSLMNSLGWRAEITLREGLKAAYASYLEEARSGMLRAA